MWRLSVLSLLIMSVGSARKCCPSDAGLTPALQCDFLEYPLQLLPAPDNDTDYLPSCSNLTVVDLYSSSTIHCVDKMLAVDPDTGQKSLSIVGVTCEDSIDDDDDVFNSSSLPMLRTFRKCCHEGVYDPDTRSCVVDLIPEIEINEVVLHNDTDAPFYLDIRPGMPECDEGEVTVDLLVNADTDVTFEEDGMILVDTHRLQFGRLILRDSGYCMDYVANFSSAVVKACVAISAVCRSYTCVRKCCAEGYVMAGLPPSCVQDERRTFVPQFYKVTTTADWNIQVDELNETIPFAVLPALQCTKYPLQPEKNPEDVHYLEANEGTLFYNMLPKPHVSFNRYCLENVVVPEYNMEGLYAFICFPESNVPRLGEPISENDTVKYLLCSLGLITSCIFFLATILVYACLPGLQNLHGKTLMCHVSSLLAAFICLSTVQLGTSSFPITLCTILGFCILFTFLAAFSWLNVMCFDIWWTFGAMRSVRRGLGSKHQRERRRFIWYSMYSWGLPSVVTAITAVMDNVPKLSPEHLKPNMGLDACWFSKRTDAVLLYFFGPLTPMITCNVILFILTARNCSKVKAEIHRMQHSSLEDRCKRRYQADKARLVMNGKLFVVMGVSWALEIVSSFVVDPPWLWYLSDAANALQGALIFSIFVLKRRVLRTLALRLGLKCRFLGVPAPSSNTTTLVVNPSCDPHRLRKSSNTSTSYSSSFHQSTYKMSISNRISYPEEVSASPW